MNDFYIKKTLDEIDTYCKSKFEPYSSKNKVFYSWNEWSGWRFYRKALLNCDFRSIIGYIKQTWLN